MRYIAISSPISKHLGSVLNIQKNIFQSEIVNRLTVHRDRCSKSRKDKHLPPALLSYTVVPYWAAIAAPHCLFGRTQLTHPCRKMLFDCSHHHCCHLQLQSCHSREGHWRPTPCTLLGRLFSVSDCWPRASVSPPESYLTWTTSSAVLPSPRGWAESAVSHTMAHFRLCLSRPFLMPLAQGEPFRCDCCSVHTGNMLGCLQVMLTSWSCIAWPFCG